MTSFERLKLRETLSGVTAREEKIIASRSLINDLISGDPAYKPNTPVIGRGETNLRLWNYHMIQSTIPHMDFQMSLDEPLQLRLGDIIFYDGSYWLVIENYNRHDIERAGLIEQCNYNLKWQNPHTLELHNRWCSVRDPYAMGIDEGLKVVVTGNAKYTIKMPHDEETSVFHLDTRFLIDIANNQPVPYQIIKFDATTTRDAARDEGFLKLTLREDELRPGVDNYELMIADYKEPNPTSVIGTVDIEFNGNPEIKAGGSYKTFTSVFTGTTNPVPQWTLELPPSLQAMIETQTDAAAGTIRLRADEKADYTSFNLKVSANGMERVININVVPLI
jgi:hypothetical protein